MNNDINNNYYINTTNNTIDDGFNAVVFGTPVEYIHEPTGYMEPIEVVSYLNEIS